MPWDAIVIGLGVMGSAATLSLVRRGARVLALERQPGVPHDRGSSHGETRVIRRAYFEDPAYVPLLGRAYESWDDLAAVSGQTLFERRGVLVAGPADGEVVRGVARASEEHGVPVERLEGSEIPRRFPGFRGTERFVGLLEPDAGLLHAERCVAALHAAALAHGAAVRLGQSVTSIRADAHGVEVISDGAPIRAGTLVVAAGAWAGPLLTGAGLPLRVLRKVQLWLRADAEAYSPRTSPVFAFDTGDRFFYGFPALDRGVVKLAEHSGGEEIAEPDALDRSLRPRDLDAVRGFVSRHLDRVHPEVVRHAACMYTVTPDGHFIVDRLPDQPRIVVVAGMSGHGFKLAPTIGELAAELALDLAASPQPLFATARFAHAE